MNPQGSSEKAIVIGANLALLDFTLVDSTNAFIAHELWENGYMGYVFLNMYNLISRKQRLTPTDF